MPHRKPKKTVTEKEHAGTTSPKSESRPHRHVDEYSEVMRNEKPCDNVFAAYIPKPNKLSIDVLAENEHVILVLRQHPITQIKWILVVFVMVALPIFFGSSGIFNFLPGSYQFAGVLGWYLMTLGFVVESFLKWFYHVFLITDERLIDVDFLSMLHKNISTTKIDKIEDVTAVTTGFLSSLFDYGTVTIQTAGMKQEIQFENVPHTARVTALLNDLMLEEELEKIEGRVN